MDLFKKDIARLKTYSYATYEAWLTAKDGMIEAGIELNRVIFLKSSKGLNRKQKKELSMKHEEANRKLISQINLQGKNMLALVEMVDAQSDKKRAEHLLDAVHEGFDRVYAKKNKK